MRFVVDENLGRSTVQLLIELGHEAYRVKGLTDRAIAARAKEEQAVIVTRDRDFANLQMLPLMAHAGVIVLRPRPPASVATVNELLRRLLTHIEVTRLRDALTIVSDDQYRIITAADAWRLPG